MTSTNSLDLGVNVPRPGAFLYRQLADVMQVSSGPRAYNWDTWAPDYSRPADPQTEPFVIIAEDYPDAGANAVGDFFELITNVQYRILSGLQVRDQMLLRVPGSIQIAFRPLQGAAVPMIRSANGLIGFDVEFVGACAGWDHLRTMHGGCPMLDWREEDEESRFDSLPFPSVRGLSYAEQLSLGEEASVPVVLTSTIADALDNPSRLIQHCRGALAIEVGNEYPWNSIFPESEAGKRRAHGGPLPPLNDSMPHDHPNRRAHGDAYRKAARVHGRTVSRLVSARDHEGSDIEIVCGGWAGAGNGLSLLREQMQGWTNNPDAYTVGGYIGHGQNIAAKVLAATSAEQVVELAREDLLDIEKEWVEIREALPDGVHLDVYEQGLHAPGAGGGDIPKRTWEIFREINEGPLGADLRVGLLEASARAGIRRVSAFELPVPGKTYDQDPKGTTLFRLGSRFGDLNPGGQAVFDACQRSRGSATPAAPKATTAQAPPPASVKPSVQSKPQRVPRASDALSSAMARVLADNPDQDDVERMHKFWQLFDSDSGFADIVKYAASERGITL